MTALVDSVNLARVGVAPVAVARGAADDDDAARPTGIGKSPVDEAIWVRDPGDRATGLGSGLVGDFIGDQRHHGGRDQAVYAFAREDLDHWRGFLGRELPGGYFGENLTTRGIDVNAALIGERWRVGATLELQVTCPRIPCATFRGWVGRPGWLKVFTQAGRPGAYLRVLTPGSVVAGDRIEVIHRPHHAVTVALVFRATTTEAQLLDQLLAAGEDLQDETRSLVQRRQTATIDD